MLRLIYFITAITISAITSLLLGQNAADKISVGGNIINEKKQSAENMMIYLMDYWVKLTTP